ncbi:MAG: XrtA system polysaccharide deacetylase [Pseudomonadota bacterium]
MNVVPTKQFPPLERFADKSDRLSAKEARPNKDLERRSDSIGTQKALADNIHNRYGMSVDVEDYFQVWAFSDQIPQGKWDQFQSRVEQSTHGCLDLFDETSVKATFFTLGWVAERFPGLVKEIVERGHEIASHGYDHSKVFNQSAEAFKADVLKTKSILEQISGVQVKGYRAAGFSIDARTPWAHEVLLETGHLYSSSSHPISHDHYGDPKAEQVPHRKSGMIEAPVATTTVFRRRVSCAGGGWFRLLPYEISSRLIKRASSELDGPVIFYFHPWEIDPQQPRIAQASLKSKVRHYTNLSSMRPKLLKLLKTYPWGRIDQTLRLYPQ